MRDWIVLGLVFLFFGGCGSDISNGNQLPGQRCFVSTDCAPGLTCYERQCVPSNGGNQNNPNNLNNRNNANNLNNINNINNITDMGFDLPPNCLEGQTACLGNTLATCVYNPIDDTVDWTTRPCPSDSRCANGQCVVEGQCVDQDSDGFGEGCRLGPDCDDGNEFVNPGMPEACRTPYDDNCDGQINEGCDQGGCDGGCADDEFCTITMGCVAYDPAFCASQDQPCEFPEQFSNGFMCVNFDGNAEPRCMGLCDYNAPDPSATCPGNAPVTCVFGDGNSGICASTCKIDGTCGSGTLGCLPWGASPDEGICLPANPGLPIGSSCEPDTSTASCAAGAICVPQGNGSGTCTEACRPFEYITDASGATDCSPGNHCAPFTSDIGVCVADNNDFEGSTCFPAATTCGQDAVGCYPSPQRGTVCQRLCRLELGAADCQLQGQRCVQFDMNQTELGVCFGN